MRKEIYYDYYEVFIMKLNEITNEHVGQPVTVEAEIINVIQTKGPTLFKITDGDGTFTIKGFIGAGKRAFPNYDVGDVANIQFTVTEHNGVLEGEARSFNAVGDSATVRSNLEAKRKEQSSVGEFSFLVTSSTTDKLREQFIAAATLIKEAVASNRPILVRHHNDCDGYSSGVVLQRAIMPLLEKQHGKKSAGRYFTRSPCRAPFYSYEDSLRDISITAGNLARFDEQPPLVLIVDNGSGAEDLLGIRQGKLYGMDFIVVDHHPYGEEDVISAEVLVHINPYLVSEDYSFTAGMLCTELAHIINKDAQNILFIAAMAGIADHTESDALEQFIQLSKDEGYTREELEQISRVIDFIANQLRNMESREVVADLFGENRERQKAMTAMLYPRVMKMYEQNISLAKIYGKQEKIGDTLMQTLDIENTFSRSSYPPAGKTTGLYHDLAAKEHDKVVTVGYGPDFVTIRATDASPFELHSVLEAIHKELPDAFADGGGHQKAGSIKFAPKAQQAVLDFIKKSLE